MVINPLPRASPEKAPGDSKHQPELPGFAPLLVCLLPDEYKL